jgi:hypothetical protein
MEWNGIVNPLFGRGILLGIVIPMGIGVAIRVTMSGLGPTRL